MDARSTAELGEQFSHAVSVVFHVALLPDGLGG
jgi:hypothetical protein